MEIIQSLPKTNHLGTSRYRPTPRPGTGRKCVQGRYVQPPRVASFAPQKTYCPPTKPLDGQSTYHESYLNVDKSTYTRAQSFKPTYTLKTIKDKFEDGTTNKISYKPVWNVVKAHPIVPRQKNLFAFKGPMETSTTVRHDFGPKNVDKPALVIPCGNIKSFSGTLDDRTTSGTSYINPGKIIPTASFKPSIKYCPPQEAILNETTQKLSYQPYRVEQREKYPWTEKPSYVPPNEAMVSSTTYSNSFFLNGQQPQKEKPFIPNANNDLFPTGQPMMKTSLYHDCFVPREITPVVPVVPCGNILISNQKMMCDTTNKLSFLGVKAEVRQPFRPKQRNHGNQGPIQSATTNRCDYIPKMVPRPEVVIPCDNIKNSSDPLNDTTTSGSSYKYSGPQQPPQSYKPQNQYQKPTVNIDGETINKSSYLPWATLPKEDYPWAKKAQYKAPKEKMTGDSSYNASYAAPGYFIEECGDDDVQNLDT